MVNESALAAGREQTTQQPDLPPSKDSEHVIEAQNDINALVQRIEIESLALDGIQVEAALKRIAKDHKLKIKTITSTFNNQVHALKQSKAQIASQTLLEPTVDGLKAERVAKVLKNQSNLFPLFRKRLRRNGYIATENFSDTLLVSHTLRLLPNSSALGVYGPYAAGKSDGVIIASGFLPPELVISITTISAKGFFYIGSVTGKYLVFGEMNPSKDDLDDMLQCSMRQLVSENRITNFTVERTDGKTHCGVTKVTEGPAVIVFTTTTEPHRWESQLRSRCSWRRADDSESTTGHIIDAVANKAAGNSTQGLPSYVLNGFRQFHRSLEPLPVVIPFAEQIKPSSRKAAIRRIFKQLLNYVGASTLLHQHVRKRDDQGRVVATIHDYKVAYRLIRDNAPRMARVISPESRKTFNDRIKPKLEGTMPDGETKTITGPEIRRELSVSKSQASRFIEDCENAGMLVYLESGGRGNTKRYKLAACTETEPDELGLIAPENISWDDSAGTNDQIPERPQAGKILVPSQHGTNQGQIAKGIIPSLVPKTPGTNQKHAGSTFDDLSICPTKNERDKMKISGTTHDSTDKVPEPPLANEAPLVDSLADKSATEPLTGVPNGNGGLKGKSGTESEEPTNFSPKEEPLRNFRFIDLVWLSKQYPNLLPEQTVNRLVNRIAELPDADRQEAKNEFEDWAGNDKDPKWAWNLVEQIAGGFYGA